jgi:hypothetical protein
MNPAHLDDEIIQSAFSFFPFRAPSNQPYVLRLAKTRDILAGSHGTEMTDAMFSSSMYQDG